MKINKDAPILIMGFGSIGKRHYKNLVNLSFTNLYVFDPLKDAFNGLAAIKKIKNLNESTVKRFKVVFICSPNNFHIKHALICAKAGCHIFIEKPLAHNLAGVKELIQVCRQKKTINMVGCNMRFHPCLSFIKKYLESGKLGKIYNIFHEFGYWLPFWRPQQDYRKNYAAKKVTGGGIIFDDIHEFDLLFWLNNFNQVAQSNFIFNNSGVLQIETEDNCLASFQFKNKVLGLVKCDYLQKSYSRKCKISGEKGNLEWDFKENIVWLKNEKGEKKLLQIKNYDINKMYIVDIKYFLKCVRDEKETFNGINLANKILKYAVEKK